MKARDVARSIFASWDIWASFVAAITFALLTRDGVQIDLAVKVFEVSISLLAVIFSIFFAALAVLITAGDNEFVRFLEEDGSYRQIIWTFRFTLLLLFFALLLSIGLYGYSLIFAPQHHQNSIPGWLMALFVFFALYALFAAVNSSTDAIRYAELRARFLKIIGKKD